MKNIPTWIACIAIVCLPACQLQPDAALIATQTATQVAGILDRDGDGAVSNREVKESGNSIELWGTILAGGLALLGGGAAVAANGKAKTAQMQVDELYDRTHKPIA